LLVIYQVPEYYAKAQKNLGDAYQNIAKIDDQKMNYEKALRAFKTALAIYNILGYKRNITEIKEELKKLSDLCNS